jgi:hypothetical protein
MQGRYLDYDQFTTRAFGKVPEYAGDCRLRSYRQEFSPAQESLDWWVGSEKVLSIAFFFFIHGDWV